jgi:hypothetical protein
MPTLMECFDPRMEMPSEVLEVKDWNDAVERVLDAAQWIHDTNDESCAVTTIVMWDEDEYQFTIYIELVPDSPHVIPIESPQIDTYTYSL